MRNRPILQAACLTIAVLAVSSPGRAITINVDYSYDTTSFFGSGNPQGPAAGTQAQAAMEAAADFFTDILNDTFSTIQTPSPFHSQQFDGVVTWAWTMNFNNPTTNSPVVLTNPTVAVDEYRVYAGARSISGGTLGIGGPGGYSWSSNSNGGGFSSTEIATINQTTSDFEADVERREEPSGFARWGGTISFDRDTSTTWHYNHTTPVVVGASDFFSVAVHELGHVLGLGASEQWENWVSGSYFVGSAASAEYGGSVPLHSDGDHWAEGTTSVVYGTAAPQEASMDPTITNGTRKRFTDLDAAALTDIGWTVIPLPGLDGDYNANGTVDAADYSRWRDTLGQSVPAGTGADGDGNGTIGTGDYTVWKNNFGTSLGAGAIAAGTVSDAVPEPSAFILFIIGGLILRGWRVRRPCETA